MSCSPLVFDLLAYSASIKGLKGTAAQQLLPCLAVRPAKVGPYVFPTGARWEFMHIGTLPKEVLCGAVGSHL